MFQKKDKKDAAPPKKLKTKREKQAEKLVAAEEKPAEKKKKSKFKRVEKEKDNDIYVMKKNTGIRILRIVFWLLIGFIFFRGVYQIVKPQKEDRLQAMIDNFRQEQQMIGDSPDEVMTFAEDFVKEYLTYHKSGERDFKDRIKPYVSKRIYGLSGIYTFRNEAKATYVNAYRRTAEDGQYNIYVNAEVMYDKGEEGMEYAGCTLKVPVIVSDVGYCVIGLPLFVEDNRLDDTYALSESVLGTEIDNKLVFSSVENFLMAYYEQDQAMINYLLATDANKEDFIGINQRYTFTKIESLRAFKKDNETDIRCILKIRILDTVNGEEIYQEFNMTLVEKDEKYYIKTMDTKITGLE